MKPEIAKEVLLEIKEILDNLHVKFWLRGGVLIGALREKNLIPSDTDIDLHMLAKDWNSSIGERFRAGSFIYREAIIYENKISEIWLCKRDIVVEIALVYYYPPEDAYIILAAAPKDCISTVCPAKFHKEDYFIEFLGERFRAPYPAEEWVEQIFGKDWRTPISHQQWLADYQKNYKTISLDKYLKWFREHPRQEWPK